MSAMKSILVVLLVSLVLPAAAQAPVLPQVEQLSVLDRQYMTQQRSLLQDLAERHLGRSFSGERERDLAILQDLLDNGVVRADQTRELQAMGVILGDLLARDLDMHWVVYLDEVGRSRALRLRDTDNFLFPITMISRRREAGNETPVAEIYRKARGIIENVREPLPFQ